MADDGQPGATPDPSGATPGSTEAPKDDAGAAGKDAKEPTPEERAIANAKAAAKRAAEERDALKTELEALKTKDLPEAERTAKRLADMEEENKRLAAELVQRDIAAEVAKAAAKVGVVDVEVVMVLLRENDAIDFDAEGKPINVEAAVKDLLKQKPYLGKAVASGADAGAGTRGGPAPGGGMNDIIRQAAGRTT